MLRETLIRQSKFGVKKRLDSGVGAGQLGVDIVMVTLGFMWSCSARTVT